MTSEQILAGIEEVLVLAIPQRVKALAINEAVYCLRIWWYGTDMPGDRTPSLTLAKESYRQLMVAVKGDKAPYYIWSADEIDSFDDREASAFRAEIANPPTAKLVASWYAQMPDRGWPDDADLIPLQTMVRRVATRLNRLRWADYASVTDDFVVMAADGSHSLIDVYGDMLASVPQERIEQLRSRRLLGTDPWWSLVPKP
jgi:hypothetical protein